MHIDESWSDDHSLHIQDGLAGRGFEWTEIGNLSIPNPDVRESPRFPSSIDHTAVEEYKILRETRRTEEQTDQN